MIWRDRATLHHGDYRETLALCDGKADLVLTSPPYADARTYGAAVSWTDADYAALGDAVFAALRPGGHALINVDAPVREWRPRFGTERGFHPWRLMLDWAERVGFRVPDRLAFGRMGQVGKPPGRFRNDWEPLLWFQRPGGDGHFDPDSIRVATRRSERAKQRRDGDRWATAREGGVYVCDSILPSTLWDYGVVGSGQTGADDIADGGHGARWPYKLAEDLVRCFCPPDGLACDPFLGAGTSMIAALEHGRRFVGGDMLSRVPDPERGLDGARWIDVAARVADARFRQERLFR